MAILNQLPFFTGVHTIELQGGWSGGWAVPDCGIVFVSDASIISDSADISPSDVNRHMWVHLGADGKRLTFQKGFLTRVEAEFAAENRARAAGALYEPFFIERFR
ncbi:hypothetical protein AOQ71_32040 [Bradyrhizobium manausense]|uniref:Uncharacterized protein n=1 Tax=Bradyrhizobium manausense TaxID=989370 RepID=A0A0R3D0J0_9BRAD|nr:hypothetical protein AOQ71_32040 [Bradyrhizobium manausense]